eukprot:scaffold267688_cov25-Prasinocladus_malaysianus.AAC.1
MASTPLTLGSLFIWRWDPHPHPWQVCPEAYIVLFQQDLGYEHCIAHCTCIVPFLLGSMIAMLGIGLID